MNESHSKIIEYLQKEGYDVYTEFYPTIDLWQEIWKGKTDFHRYIEVYDGQKFTKEMYSLGMAKRISEDWASICWTEKDKVNAKDKLSQEFLEDKLKNMKFYKELFIAIEKSASLGTCGAVLRVKDIKLSANGEFIANKFSRYDLILLNANQIIPLKTENGKIIDVALVSESMIGKDKIYYIEIHEKVRRIDKNGEEYESYRIRNIYINKDGKEITKENVIREYYTNSDIPLFSILTTPLDNPCEEANGLGFSMYGDAIDQLQGVDIVYHNMIMDFYLGGKKMFYNKNLTQRDERGNVIYPTDIQKQQFMIVGDPMENANENSLIYEYNPDLRVEENNSGLQQALDLLSFKCGLGTKYYQFNSGTIVTATQYMGDRQDLVVNARKYRENVDEFVENICRGILLLGRLIFKENVDENTEIEVASADGFLTSEEDLKAQYINEIASGLRNAWEYRVKFFGEDEETAKRMIANEEIDEEEGE